ncbi:MAG: pyruvate, phosphate dikinase [Pirellulales bacterium]|nr:pyruvate, phosphate dikinase [Pirellulales bacterium]
MTTKYVYYFGPDGTEGDAGMKNTLGGKGANLAEMAKLGLPVPAGFTISTNFCTAYFAQGRQFPPELKAEVEAALNKVQEAMGRNYGDPENPLLLSCRSGARSSMPGMMETVLNVGLCSTTIPGLENKTGNKRFVWDAYRRLIMMYSDVVMEKAEDIEPAEGKGVRMQLEHLMARLKKRKGYTLDTEMTADDLKNLCKQFKKKVVEVLGREFPDDPQEQLWGAIGAVFKSWEGKRAVAYRKIENIPGEWGTACNVQSMVFGNLGEGSATGVAFSRNPATGENKFYGEWLVNAQGEDVVAGIRTPNPLNEATKNPQNQHLPSLETAMPELYRQLDDVRVRLEQHYKDMQDIEFTIQEGKLYMLQCRVGKRTGTAALNMAMEMLTEGLIDEKTAVMRVAPAQLDELLHPIINAEAEKNAQPFLTGLPAGPGGACGKIVFTSADAVAWHKRGEKVILVREETNPEDVEGMRAAEGILTARGGMTSHAALVARGWGKCCIVGAGDLKIELAGKKLSVKQPSGGEVKLGEGDLITLNGTKGRVYAGALEMIAASENPRFKKFMELVDKFRTMGVRTNADTPEDARVAREFGAEGIGLFRTEHMFYGVGSDEPLFLLRKMIMVLGEKAKSARTKQQQEAAEQALAEKRRAAVYDLFPFVKRSIKATLEAMDGLPVTIRLLDPPLHEFVPQGPVKQKELADALGIKPFEVKKRGEALHETNPMMGHRGVRLGVSYPDVTEMQVQAIFEAAAELIQAGRQPHPELMVPVTCDVSELDDTKVIFDRVKAEVEGRLGVKVPCLYGTMIEIPRACLLADKIAKTAEFFSFGTNDLTQMTFGFSRDDIGGFLNDYLSKNLLEADPFQTIDQEGVGQLIQMAVVKGRGARNDLKIGICGEQGGDPASVRFCYQAHLNYVSCSPYRVPIARLAAAQAAIKAGH